MPGTALLESTDTVLDAVRGLRVGELTDQRAAEVLEGVIRMRNALAGAEVLLAAKASQALRRPGVDGAAEGLARLTGTSAYEAKKVLETGRRLGRLEVVEAAVRNGKLSGRQVRDIADAAVLDPTVQGDLIDTATRSDRQGLVEACRAVKDRVLDVEVRHARVHRDRSIVFSDDLDTGGRRAVMTLTRDMSAEIEAILAGFAEPIFKQARKDGTREPHSAYLADALLHALRIAAGTADATATPTVREVVIVVDRSALLRGHTIEGERCEIRGLGAIPVPVAREFMGDAFIKGVLVDGVDVQHVKHFGRAPSAALKTALDLRWDGKCACGECTRRFRLEYDHHNTPYGLGGEHSMANTRPTHTAEHRHKTQTVDMPRIHAAKRTGTDPGPSPPRGSPDITIDQAVELGLDPFHAAGQDIH